MKNAIDPIEKYSHLECYEKIDKPLLINQLHYIAENSEFYRQKCADVGLSADGIKDLDLFNQLPFTYKEELLAEQMSFPPYGRLAVTNRTDILRRVHATSGSTGQPLYIVLTGNDISATVESGRRAFVCAGLSPEDTVIHCLNYCLWAGGLTDHLNLEATGATVIPFGVGNSKKLIQTILDLHPTAISCTPSYLSRLEYLLNAEFNMLPKDLGLQKAFLGAEGGLQNIMVRSRIEKTWGIKAIDANYGMADVLSIFGAECEDRTGLHFHGQGNIYLELVDPEGNKNIPVEPGQVGEMVLTNLKREAQPLVRYKTRDLIKIIETEQCSCGRQSLRFLVLGRVDDMVTIRGINVFPNAVAHLLVKHADWFTGEFEIVLDSPPPFEKPLLRVELKTDLAGIDTDNRINYLLNECHQQLNFTPRIELMSFGEFPRNEGKTSRVKRRFGSDG